MYRIKTQKITKKLLDQLKLVTNKEQISLRYYHLATNGLFYIYELDQYSKKDIDSFIKKKVIFVKG